MGKKYSRLWFKIHEILKDTRKKIYRQVEEMCEEIRKDIGSCLDELAERYKFTYVIEPKESDGGSYDCKPCVFIKASKRIITKVKREVLRRYPDIVSDGRLVFEQRIKNPLLQEEKKN